MTSQHWVSSMSRTWFVDRHDDCVAHERDPDRPRHVLVDYEDFFQASWRKVFKLMYCDADHELMEAVENPIYQQPIRSRNWSLPDQHSLSGSDAASGSEIPGYPVSRSREGLTHRNSWPGDGSNDLTMFQVVGQAVVMANASEDH